MNEWPLSVKNPVPKPEALNRSFLLLSETRQKSLKNLLPQTLGKKLFDFVMYLAIARRPDARAQRSVRENGPKPAFAIRRMKGRFDAKVKTSAPTKTCGYPEWRVPDFFKF